MARSTSDAMAARAHRKEAAKLAQALKGLLKKLVATGGHVSAELEFEQELYHGITAVNAFFIEKERELLSALPQHDGSAKAGASADATEAFFKEVSELYACVILNYLAVLKIVKVRRLPVLATDWPAH